jgi:predicted DNA-binding transcriptional regulator YafY
MFDVQGDGMERHERFRKIGRLFRKHRVLTTKRLIDELGVSVATVKRDLDYLRDMFEWPISQWNSEEQGYVLEDDEHALELPGLWFSAAEIHALLTMQHLLKDLQPGLLEERLRPIQARLRRLMEHGGHSADAIEQRVKLITLGMRRVEAKHFEVVSNALLDRKRLQIVYRNRDRQEVTDREISPLQLVHYRENWILDAWCHMRAGIRSFSLDAMQQVATLDKKARDVGQKVLAEHFEGGYGIVAGEAKFRAKLKFTAARAQWVSLETWHPKQRSEVLDDGSYILEVPYSNDQELLMDLLRHGNDVEVLEPPELRQKIAVVLAEAAEKYLPRIEG